MKKYPFQQLAASTAEASQPAGTASKPAACSRGRSRMDCTEVVAGVRNTGHQSRWFYDFLVQLWGLWRPGNSSIGSASRFCAISRYEWANILHGEPFHDKNMIFQKSNLKKKLRTKLRDPCKEKQMKSDQMQACFTPFWSGPGLGVHPLREIEGHITPRSGY